MCLREKIIMLQFEDEIQVVTGGENQGRIY